MDVFFENFDEIEDEDEFIDRLGLLIEEGIFDFGAKDFNGRTTLHLACERGFAYFLEEYGQEQDVNEPDRHGSTPLHLAVENRHLLLVGMLLEDPEIDVNVVDGEGQTPLTLAFGDDDIVCALLEHSKIDPAVPGARGKTPLHLACEHGFDQAFEMIIGFEGVDPSAEDSRGYTPMYYGKERGYLQELLSHPNTDRARADPDGNNALHYACEIGDLDCLGLLSEQEVMDLNVPNSAGHTPLMAASLANHGDVASSILQCYQALEDPNGADARGETALHRACGYGDSALVRYLLGRGADPSIPSSGGSTPLHRASSAGRAEVVAVLLGCGRNLGMDQVGDDHRTALEAAQGSPEVERLFLQHGIASNQTARATGAGGEDLDHRLRALALLEGELAPQVSAA